MRFWSPRARSTFSFVVVASAWPMPITRFTCSVMAAVAVQLSVVTWVVMAAVEARLSVVTWVVMLLVKALRSARGKLCPIDVLQSGRLPPRLLNPQAPITQVLGFVVGWKQT